MFSNLVLENPILISTILWNYDVIREMTLGKNRWEKYEQDRGYVCGTTWTEMKSFLVNLSPPTCLYYVHIATFLF